MKKFLFLVMMTAVVVAAGYVLLEVGFTDNSKSDLALENVEALSQGDASLDCRYVRKTDCCTIHVGTKGKVTLLSGTILTANAEGNITIDGVVICSSGGTSACKPVECIDLYKAF